MNAAHARHFWGVGKFNWVLQTYLHLRDAGVACTLDHLLAPAGIVVSHRHFLPDSLEPGAERLLVCVLADKEEPGQCGRHPFAQIHVVQNPRDPMLGGADPWVAQYLPFWTQIDLVPRSLARGSTFQNIGFFGIETNAAAELLAPAWQEWVAARGMTFGVVPRDRWHDYSAMDLVLGIRSFGAETFHWKPATKLHNAWHAGVPAIMGRDSACAAERRGPFDYLEVHSLDGLTAAIDRLAAAPELRVAMSQNGLARANETSDEQLTSSWRDFLAGEATLAWRRWCALEPAEQAGFLARRRASLTAGK